MDKEKICPRCGRQMTKMKLKGDKMSRWTCISCGFRIGAPSFTNVPICK